LCNAICLRSLCRRLERETEPQQLMSIIENHYPLL
jgi:hypothetical protein